MTGINRNRWDNQNGAPNTQLLPSTAESGADVANGETIYPLAIRKRLIEVTNGSVG